MLSVVSLAVGGIGAISLVVGAIGILTMMWIAVGERTGEIGLMRALGATRRQVLQLFLLEAVMLSVAGGAVGVLGGLRPSAGCIRSFFPGLPMHTTPGYVFAALAVSLP